jgi:hypothetical protein
MKSEQHASSTMTGSLYTFTSFSPSSTYSCSTYRAELSSRYGICQSLHDPQTLDLASVSLIGISVGNMISGFFLGLCVLGMLLLLKWAMGKRMRRRRWSWGLDPSDEVRDSEEARHFGKAKGVRIQRAGKRWGDWKMASFGV